MACAETAQSLYRGCEGNVGRLGVTTHTHDHKDTVEHLAVSEGVPGDPCDDGCLTDILQDGIARS